MKNFAILLSIIVCLIFHSSCASKKSMNDSINPDVKRAYKFMSGSFSSEDQSLRDSSYFDISLEMHPIWKNDNQGLWLYVEQAVSSMKDRPYRQRVYKVYADPTGMIVSKVFELPSPDLYINQWTNEDLFSKLSPNDLIEREGCAVYLKETSNGCFKGATQDDECKSSLRGASFATSIVEICDDRIISWDQGWNNKNEQVWGAVKGGYVFNKK